MYHVDTETCGLHGPTVLIQWAIDKGPVHLHHVWRVPIRETLELIRCFCEGTVCGFNLAFDWFHLCQTYTVLDLLGKEVGYDAIPEEHIEAYARLEPLGRDGPCLKPAMALDLLLFARKGPYQSTMDRKDILIKRVPKGLAYALAKELEVRLTFKDIYFARRKNVAAAKWQVEHIKQPDGTYHPDFMNVVLRFAPSAALKTLASDALGKDTKYIFTDVEPDRHYRPIEFGYAPFALAVSSPAKRWRAKKYDEQGNKKNGFAWPAVIKYHISHWAFHEPAKEYAELDVVYLQELYDFFGCPEPNDDDSILACCVAAVRWRGYKFDAEKIKAIKRKTQALAAAAPKSPKKVFEYVSELLNESERAWFLEQGTKKVILEGLAKRKMPCMACANVMHMIGVSKDDSKCPQCGGTGETKEPHPASKRAQECLDARKSTKKVELLDKLLKAGRFHASFKVIGTLSGRMSGADELNPQGIDHSKEVRSCFELAWGDLTLRGGDFSSFEISIADAVYNDANLRAELCRCTKCKGVLSLEQFAAHKVDCPLCGQADVDKKGNRESPLQKFHGLFAMALDPEKSYDEILATKGSSDDLYDKGKRGGFGMMYGGDDSTLVKKLGVSAELAMKAFKWFNHTYKGVGIARERIIRDFCSMRQPKGLGTKVEWFEPKEYIESLTGFKRYFTLENDVCRVLFKLANKPPDHWKDLKVKVIRRKDGPLQWAHGAVQSALYGAAFGIQGQMMRAAANHEIQSTGAILTKALQVKLWNLQPSGINPWVIQPMNIHDEIMAPSIPSLREPIRKIVDDFVESKRSLVPLIKIDWSDDMQTWAEK